MGLPSPIVARDIISEHIDLADSQDLSTATTYAYSIFYHYGLESITAVEILNHEQTSVGLFKLGIQKASEKAPIIFTGIGPVLNSMCTFLSSYPEHVFVVVSGNNAQRLEPEQYPACGAKNIIRVAAYDNLSHALFSSANWGSLVRIAAPARNILVENNLGEEIRVSNTTVAAAQVAARLVIFSRQQNLKGAALVDAFLATQSVTLPRLVGLIEEGRLLTWQDACGSENYKLATFPGK
jgi:hypothetical protein